jgi:hypothetical protein
LKSISLIREIPFFGGYVRIKTFIKRIYNKFGKRPFTSSRVFQDFYTPYEGNISSVYNAVHKCWKMGLLSRKKLWGNKYLYKLTDWGVRYVEDGDSFRRVEIEIKLLSYIIEYGSVVDKKWAEEKLAPRLLQRFFPGRKAQDIDPLIDLSEAAKRVTKTLKTRIKDEAIASNEDFLLESANDGIVLLRITRLLMQLYPEMMEDIILDMREYRNRIKEVIFESIEELENPQEYFTIRGFGRRGQLRALPADKPKIELRPNPKERERLGEVIEKLYELLQYIQ